MSRFTHPSFAPRTLKQQTVCIVCQRWFCNIKNSDPKSRFYNTVQKPECYFLWLGERADTPEAQAEFLAAPYKGEGRLTVGWRRKTDATCSRCASAALTLEAQANNKKAMAKKPLCLASTLLPGVKHTSSGNYYTSEHRKDDKGPVLFTWKGRCCKKACADAVAKALYQHEHENVPYPEGFTPPST